MSVRISNAASQVANNSINKSNSLKKEAQRQLVSGVRIFSASQEPGGIALSEKFRAKINSLRESSQNIGTAQSMIRVAAGATETAGGTLMRMRALAVRAASGTLGPAERAQLQQEVMELQSGLDSLAKSTEFSGLDLADGSTPDVDVQVGDMAGDTIAVSLGDLRTTSLGVDAGSVSVATQVGAESAIGAIDQALDQVHSQAATYGTAYNRLGSSFGAVQSEVESMLAAEGRINNVEAASAASRLARSQVLENAGLAVMVQANTNSSMASRLLS